jgi:hypothetical protein
VVSYFDARIHSETRGPMTSVYTEILVDQPRGVNAHRSRSRHSISQTLILSVVVCMERRCPKFQQCKATTIQGLGTSRTTSCQLVTTRIVQARVHLHSPNHSKPNLATQTLTQALNSPTLCVVRRKRFPYGTALNPACRALTSLGANRTYAS